MKFDTIRWGVKFADLLPQRNNQPQAELVIRKALSPIKLEMVARKYLTGTTGTSISQRYFQGGERKFDDITLENGMTFHQELPKTILTPTTKAKNDENLDNEGAIKYLEKQIKKDNEEAQGGISNLQKAVNKLGSVERLYLKMKEITTSSLDEIHRQFKQKGLIVPDLKLEFGVDKNGDLYLMDEKGSPGNLRIWNQESLKEAQENLKQVEISYDKDFLRREVNSSDKFQEWKNTPAENGNPSIQDQIKDNQAHKFDRGFKAYNPPTSTWFPKEKVADYANMLLYIHSFITGRAIQTKS